MVKLKEENRELREQLKKAKHRITQLGVGRQGEGLLSALASFSNGLGTDQHSIAPSICGERSVAMTPGPSRGGLDPQTPKRPATPTRKTAAPRSARGPRSAKEEAEERAWREAEDERRRLIQERAVERVQVDFQHFIALIERAVLAGDCTSDDSCSNPAALLDRLRAVVVEGPTQRAGGRNEPGHEWQLRTPRTELQYPDTDSMLAEEDIPDAEVEA
ncbi:unnamed protein product [Polarella glacialis]|uniref:Uncharacterized protein n=1 Tax=Polarella glacialis TaxID=89957 RepID=A0A813D054_POLGL|nr:unnamed protein product [Polarella glacialis]